MKIALISENSQAAKNGIIHDALTSVAEPLGHEVHNYGMYTAEDERAAHLCDERPARGHSAQFQSRRFRRHRLRYRHGFHARLQRDAGRILRTGD